MVCKYEYWRLGIPEKLESGLMFWTPGHLDSGHLDAWTLGNWTLVFWTFGLWILRPRKFYLFLVTYFLLLFRHVNYVEFLSISNTLRTNVLWLR